MKMNLLLVLLIVLFVQISITLAQDKIRILSVGDSITDGFPFSSDHGYRKYFQHFLHEKGIENIDMVGPNASDKNELTYDWNGVQIKYDPGNSGFSGFTIFDAAGRSGIKEKMFDQHYDFEGKSGNMLEAYTPNIVMLMIGTNDLLLCELEGIGDKIEKLIDLLIPYLSGDKDMLYVASIPYVDVDRVHSWSNAYEEKMGIKYNDNPTEFTNTVIKAIDEYNSSIKNLVEKKKGEGKKIEFSDINSCLDPKKDLHDGCHPSEDGYSKMGRLWAEVLLSTYFK